MWKRRSEGPGEYTPSGEIGVGPRRSEQVTNVSGIILQRVL